MPHRLRTRCAGALAVVALVAWPAAALGHADLVSSDPADGSTVAGPYSGPITLVFSEALADGSQAVLSGPSGSTFTIGPDPSDATRTRMLPITSAALLLPAGAYTIEWTSVAGDGDIERGTIRFTVGTDGSPSATAGPTSSPKPEPTAGPTAEPSPAPGDNVEPSGVGPEVIVAIVAGLIVVALVAWRLLRRGSTAA